MLFNSYVFILAFLPVVLLLWWTPVPTTLRLLFLAAASYFFYAWGGWEVTAHPAAHDPFPPHYGVWLFPVLMLGTTLVDYFAGRAIGGAPAGVKRKAWLVASLVFNLGLLAFFKYYHFFTDTINRAALAAGQAHLMPAITVVLPVGISFYIFESLTYTIDIYKGIAKPANSFSHYLVFISIFPKLVAGPIIRYTDVEEQYRSLPRSVDWELMQRGICFFVYGLAKKLLVADLLASQINPMFAQYHSLGLYDSWGALLGYSFQIYFDFSAYSDMAVGLGSMLGFRFPQNFNRPYLATNISNFWDRWHISLSRWLRDYLFIPLGGSRGGAFKTIRNLVITMFLGGLWHGANWTFVLWGLYHGGLLAGFHTFRHLLKDRAPKIPVWISRPFVFLLVTLGWLLFRSPDFVSAAYQFQTMLGLHGMAGAYNGSPTALWTVVGCAALWTMAVPEIWDWELAPKRRWAFGLAVVALACVLRLGAASPFLYFQF